MIQDLENKLKAIMETSPRWVVVVTDARTEEKPPASCLPVASYVDLASGLRFWFLHRNATEDLADAQRSLDHFSRSGIPILPGIRVILRDESGNSEEVSLQDFLAMVDLTWSAHVSRELGLHDRAEELNRQLEEFRIK